MIQNYKVVSPSLAGVLTHESLMYDGIVQPIEILRALDGPSRDPKKPNPPHEDKILERYFYDLYGVFMKRLSQFVLEPQVEEGDTVKLQAMLQEMVKVKKLIMQS